MGSIPDAHTGSPSSQSLGILGTKGMMGVSVWPSRTKQVPSHTRSPLPGPSVLGFRAPLSEDLVPVDEQVLEWLGSHHCAHLATNERVKDEWMTECVREKASGRTGELTNGGVGKDK